MKGQRIKQINNLVIYYTVQHGYSVCTPDGRCWEDGLILEQAEDYCKSCTMFVNGR